MAECNTGRLFYAAETKNKWAHKWWEAAAMRVDENRPVLFVPGPTSRDVGRALKNNRFQPWRLMAVDVEQQNVSNVRKRRIAVRNEPIQDTLRGWPKARPLGFVSADMTWAPGQNYLSLNHSLLTSDGVDENTIIGINVAAGNLTAGWREHREITENRAVMVMDSLLSEGLDRCILAGYIKPEHKKHAAQELIGWMEPTLFDRYKRHKRAMPMDSAQFRFPFPSWSLGDRRNTQSIRGTLAHMTRSRPHWSWDHVAQKWVYDEAP